MVEEVVVYCQPLFLGRAILEMMGTRLVIGHARRANDYDVIHVLKSLPSVSFFVVADMFAIHVLTDRQTGRVCKWLSLISMDR